MSCLQRNDRQLFQYKNSASFNLLLDAIYNAIDQASMCDLLAFYNLYQATGVWLTNLAGLFNVKRVYVNLGGALLWDTGGLVWDTNVWDGQAEAISDDLLRSLLIARIKKNNSDGVTIEYVYDIILTSFNPTYLKVSEGTKTITIDITFATNAEKITFNAIVNAYPQWFGKPAGVSVIYNYI